MKEHKKQMLVLTLRNRSRMRIVCVGHIAVCEESNDITDIIICLPLKKVQSNEQRENEKITNQIHSFSTTFVFYTVTSKS